MKIKLFENSKGKVILKNQKIIGNNFKVDMQSERRKGVKDEI